MLETDSNTIQVTDRKLSALAAGVNLESVVKALPNLEELCSKKLAAAMEFSEACKAAAQNARIEASVIKRYVAAIIGEKLEENKLKAEQLQLLFDELP